MAYTVVIEQDGEQARLDCETYAEAVQVKVSFENYGKCQSIEIESKVPSVDKALVLPYN